MWDLSRWWMGCGVPRGKRGQKSKEARITRESDAGKRDGSVFIKINTAQNRAPLPEPIVECSNNTHMHTHTRMHHHQGAL